VLSVRIDRSRPAAAPAELARCLAGLHSLSCRGWVKVSDDTVALNRFLGLTGRPRGLVGLHSRRPRDGLMDSDETELLGRFLGLAGVGSCVTCVPLRWPTGGGRPHGRFAIRILLSTRLWLNPGLCKLNSSHIGRLSTLGFWQSVRSGWHHPHLTECRG